jgi:hypothetical protein
MYGIITDYSRWVFIKRTAKGIKWCREFITERTHDADVARVAGRLHAILEETSDDVCWVWLVSLYDPARSDGHPTILSSNASIHVIFVEKSEF